MPHTITDTCTAFGCHTINGAAYLRADYAVVCYSAEWWPMAIYASVFLVCYVVALPVFVVATLIRYGYLRQRGQLLAGDMLLLGFLLDDYQPSMPAMLWDGE